MNHIYRIVFNRNLGLFQVASELNSSNGKTKSKAIIAASGLIALLSITVTPPTFAAAGENLLVGAGGNGGSGSSGAGGGGGIGGGGGSGGGGGGGIGGGGAYMSPDGGSGGSGASGGTGGDSLHDGGDGGLGGGGGAGGSGGGGGALGGGGGKGGGLQNNVGAAAGINPDGSGQAGGSSFGGSGSLFGGGGGGDTGTNGGGGGGGGKVVDESGNNISGATASAGASGAPSLTFTTNDAYAFIGIGGGGGGGSNAVYAGNAGSAGSLVMSSNTQLTVSRSMLVGGSGGGGGGGIGGGGGTGNLYLSNGSTLNVSETLLIGGSGGGAGLYSAGGTGGAATVTIDTGAAVSVGAALVLGGFQGGSNSFRLGGNGGTGVLNFGAGSLQFSPGATFLINTAGTLNLGSSVPDATGTGTITGITSLTNNGLINFNQSNTTYTFSVDLSGSGQVVHNSAGTTILTGTNIYSGTTSVNSGVLSVNGSINGSTITINNGGILGGSGSVSNVSVMSGGILAPGNSIGTLTVNGGLTFNAGGIYRVEVDALGNADRTVVNGNLALNGNVDVLASAGTYATNTAYTILTNTGTQTGTFAGVTSNLAFLTPTLSYGANNVVLNLARNAISFGKVATTANQRASSTALEKAAVGASGDLSTVITAVTGLSADEARAAYDAIGGAGLNALRRAAPAFANNFGNQLRARLNAVGASTSASANSLNGIQLAANDHLNDLMPMLAQAPQQKFTLAGGIPQTPTDTRGFWLRAYGSDQDTDGDGNAAGNRIKDTGISLGFDTKINHDLVIGAALTHGSADINTDNNENGRSRGNAVALYGSYASGAWNFNGSATLARNDNSMQRRIVFGGIDRIAQSDFDSDNAALYGDVTYAVAMNGWTLQPLMGLSLSRSKSDAFTETGAGALNLQVASQTTNSAKTLFGAKAIFDFNKVQLQPRVIWSHEFGDANSAMTSQLQGAPTPFAISGVDLPRDTLIAGLTIVGRTNERLSLFADVQGEFNSQQTNLGLLIGLRASW